MEEKEVFDKVSKLINDAIGTNVDEIKSTSAFIDDLGADSLDIVELVMQIERDFDIEIPDEDAELISTVGDAVGYILKVKSS